MKNLNIVVFGKNEVILNTLKRLIESNSGWKAIIQQDIASCKTYLSSNTADILLLSSGLSSLEEQAITAHLSVLDYSIGLIHHYGGGSGLLKNEIYSLFPSLVSRQ